MPNGLELLSKISGEPKEKVKHIWEEVKENRRKLDGCAKHQFGDIVVVGRPMRVACKNCGGLMDPLDVLLYQRGYAAAGGDPDDVCVFVDKDSG
jgi:hypothetical protein